jgi:hypothetical protein
MEEWKYSSTILNLGTRWRDVVSFTPLLLYPQGNSPHQVETMGEFKNCIFRVKIKVRMKLSLSISIIPCCVQGG